MTKKQEDLPSSNESTEDKNRRLLHLKIAELPGRKKFNEFDLKLNPKTKEGYQACIEWSGLENEPFLTLYGKVGTGKTHLAIASGYRLIEDKGQLVRFFSSTELIRQIQNDMNQNILVPLIDQVKKTQILILDDLGREYSTSWPESIYHELIDYRYANKLRTLVTTNHSISELEKIVGVPVVSRLKDSQIGRFIVMDGKDVREQ